VTNYLEALRNGYHGAAGAPLGLTALHTWKYPVPHDFGIKHTLNPDTYRGPFKASDPEAGSKYAWHLKVRNKLVNETQIFV
jgi:hypothetical protein